MPFAGKQAHVITAITVQRGLIDSGNLLKPGGWEKPRDLVVSMVHVARVQRDKVMLRLTEEEFLSLPPYVTGDVPDQEMGSPSPRFIAEDLAMRAGAMLGGSIYEPRRVDIENRAPGEHHVSHETKVWQRDPHTHIGDLDRIFIEDDPNRITSLVVRRGLLGKHEVIIPSASIIETFDDLLHVEMSPDELNELQDYTPEDEGSG
jgi:hypothetical protein